MENSSNKDEEGQKHLPDDLITQQILPWLPVKPLTQYKVISKQVLSSLSSPNFILNHTKQPLFSHPGPPVEQLFIQCNNHYLLYSCVTDDNVTAYNNCVRVDDFVLLNVEFAIDEGDVVDLVGSSEGLVCLAESYGKYFFLYNPTTNQSHKYYPGDFELIKNANDTRPCVSWGFGHVSSVNDYKVVRIMMYLVNVFSTIHVFSLNSNCWRKIEFELVNGPQGPLYGGGKLVDETLYWVKLGGPEKNQTLAFDLESETCSWFHHLKTKTISNDVLCVMGGCLSRCGGSNSENEVVFDILRGAGRVVCVSFVCNLRIHFRDEVIGFTKTGKVFVANTDTERALISLIDQNSNRPLITFVNVVGDRRRSTAHIQSYVPSETSPLPPTEMPTSSTQGTWATSYEVELVEDDDDDDIVEELDLDVQDDDPVEDVVIVLH